MDRSAITTMMTMADVAKRARVSRSTVSHVLSDRHGDNVRIPQATRQRVLDAASELGYRPNALARSVRSGKSRMIGYLVSDPHYEPYWKTLIGALAEAEQAGFTLKVLSVTPGTFDQRIRQCMELRLGGLIVRVDCDKDTLFKEAGRAGVPVVMVDESVPQPFGVRVASDDALGFQAAIAHLMELGHRRIGFISSGFLLPRGETVPTREGLFLREMAAQGLEVPAGYVAREAMLVYGSATEAGLDESPVFAATHSLLEHPSGRPTALFCWRDETALVAMRACRLHGLRVPEDISVMGFSDIGAARLCDPPLTTGKSPWEEMGRTAVRQLVRVLEEESAAVESAQSSDALLIPSGLVVRKSTGLAPG